MSVGINESRADYFTRCIDYFSLLNVLRDFDNLIFIINDYVFFYRT